MDLLIIFTASYLPYFGIALGLFGGYLALKAQGRGFLALALGVLLLTYLGGVGARALYDNPRPFVVGGFSPLIEHAPDNGFPSDHTLLLAGLGAALVPFSRRIGLYLFALAALVGAARVLAGVHHSIDILGALGIAALAGLFLQGFVRYVKKRAG